VSVVPVTATTTASLPPSLSGSQRRKESSMTTIDQIIAGSDPLARRRGLTSESAEAQSLYEQVLAIAPSLERQVAAPPRRHRRALVASSAAALLALATGLSPLVIGNN